MNTESFSGSEDPGRCGIFFLQLNGTTFECSGKEQNRQASRDFPVLLSEVFGKSKGDK